MICGHKLTGLSQSKGWHVDIDIFVSTRLRQISFVPNANATIGPNGSIKSLPSREMSGISGLRISKQCFTTAPILNEDGVPGEPELMMQQPQFRIFVQLAQHLGHCRGNRPPLSNRQGAINPHADEKDGELAAHSSRHPFAMEHFCCARVSVLWEFQVCSELLKRQNQNSSRTLRISINGMDQARPVRLHTCPFRPSQLKDTPITSRWDGRRSGCGARR